ncbi:GspE/PulE family protein [Bacillus thuringiensis]|uniref:GspE/PulE family protein n=1 Tax=Bacillus thuringiensis TaxID=1428 RepID=UPI00159BB5A5|nr:ATPase, T2SS/T4P/T4SS family [Bacillus thuringiensis]
MTRELYYDVNKDMDISFGEEYRRRQKTDTFFTANAIRSDERLNRLVDIILNEAIEMEAKDVHINQWSTEGMVEFRLGSDLVPIRRVNKYAVDGLIIVLRNRADVSVENIHALEISGRITHRYAGKDFDIRASFIPATNGQTAVLRILNVTQLGGSVEGLGLPDSVEMELKRVLNLKEGMVILSGGTGSGKTTTLYTSIVHIKNTYEEKKKIYAIEDPVEYRVDGVTQISTDEMRDVTFANALKSILRGDPNVILLGEINDERTAKTAVRSATTGHLMLTTIHANNTLEVRNVLKQLGASPIDLGTALKMVIYQTLQDKLCEHCRIDTTIGVEDKRWVDKNLRVNKDLLVVYERNHEGCEHCHQGVKGQVLLVEMLRANRVYNRGVDETDGDIRKLQDYLLETDGAKYYPLEWDVFKHLENGNIDMNIAYHLID